MHQKLCWGRKTSSWAGAFTGDSGLKADSCARLIQPVTLPRPHLPFLFPEEFGDYYPEEEINLPKYVREGCQKKLFKM